jgi:hypothetical protein
MGAVAALLVLGAGCGSNGDPSWVGSAVSSAALQHPTSPPTASPTSIAYTGNRVAVTNGDNGRTVSAPVGSHLTVNVTFPLTQDCVPPHKCVMSKIDDAGRVLLHSQELTTCDTKECTLQREVFLDRRGTATLSLVTVDPCPANATARCMPKEGPPVWSVKVSVS